MPETLARSTSLTRAPLPHLPRLPRLRCRRCRHCRHCLRRCRLRSCVESTMRSAYERGYQVITLTDCCAATRCGRGGAGRPGARAGGRVGGWVCGWDCGSQAQRGSN